jgi:hypothetical protein
MSNFFYGWTFINANWDWYLKKRDIFKHIWEAIDWMNEPYTTIFIKLWHCRNQSNLKMSYILHLSFIIKRVHFILKRIIIIIYWVTGTISNHGKETLIYLFFHEPWNFCAWAIIICNTISYNANLIKFVFYYFNIFIADPIW